MQLYTNEKTTNEEIESFIDLKTGLKVYRLDFEDIPKFVQLLDSIKELGFDINKVLSPIPGFGTFGYQA
jgi:hypothetical protein